jgi:5-hydroxyisourate hydrolase
MSRISTHVLDTSRGQPAAGVAVVLERARSDGVWTEVGRGVTDADGRVADLLPSGAVLTPGVYCLRFATGAYFLARGEAAFYPEVVVQVRLDQAARWHLPLLLSPYGYSTYRGS